MHKLTKIWYALGFSALRKILSTLPVGLNLVRMFVRNATAKYLPSLKSLRGGEKNSFFSFNRYS